jgi:hypothetical protein
MMPKVREAINWHNFAELAHSNGMPAEYLDALVRMNCTAAHPGIVCPGFPSAISDCFKGGTVHQADNVYQDPREDSERISVFKQIDLEKCLVDEALILKLDGTSGDPDLEKRIAAVMVENFNLWKERQRKYGRHNISAFGAAGTVVRASDKLARLRRHFFETDSVASDESVEDSFRDLANYAVMGVVCYRGQWPKE